MAFHMAARQAFRAISRPPLTTTTTTPRLAASLPRPTIFPSSIRFLATPPSSQKPDPKTNTTKDDPSTSSSSTTTTPTPEEAKEELKTGKTSSIFDIDTSAAPRATQLIESETPQPGNTKDSTGAKAKTGARSMSSIERRRQTTVRLLSALILGGSTLTLCNLGRPWDNELESTRFASQPGSDSFLGRIKLRLGAMYEDFNKPVFDQLLPDPLPFPYSRPFTMVLDLDDLLVHSEWSREHGWRTAKRPGLDYFIGYLSQFYEIVLFTTQPFFTAGPIIEKLDPDRRFITYTLFKESCRTVDGKLVKDLNYLNRDLSKVVVVDTNPDSFYLHPQNGIVVEPWQGDREDRELVGLIPFFEAIAIYGIEDVRTTLKAYTGTHIPSEHARRAAQIREKELAENKARAKRLSKFGSVFGGVSRTGNMPVDKTVYELERERYVQAYLEDQKYWKENGEMLRKQAKEEQERQIREMKLNTWAFFTGGMKPQAARAEGQQGEAAK
ncbi:related to TIM50-mitochondrial inner membrane import translocase subunit [Ustilago bromivora]|uniref:Mitochondrial import inner membrane translocase subunit TIM50 n=1 Tax=Ustilago bromivora TaxID=307758 RepID=A0A1K0G060_9BASI|nr:related to TIM50-mitochondrial inner membrane import translocase subunit [Ustilago bromivora]SYW79378.1 related to TIM50 - mitochondrial inner membrane import translocase subunit [Ustilago bromivora]